MKSPIDYVSLPDVVGGGYGAFWRWRGRFRVCKGSRRSKKSTTTALWLVVNLVKHPQANALVVRKVFRTLHDSCFAQIKWAIHQLHLDGWFDCKESPLEITYRPTGQKIYFRGLDDPLKITSITVEHGALCWLWVEEAYEITSEDAFDALVESLMGDCPPTLWKQVTVTFNPWNEHHWLKRRFFDRQDPEVLAITTNYTCNEWLSDADRAYFSAMARNNPRRYRVAGLGEWGVSEGTVYTNWEEKPFDIDQVRALPSVRSCFGLDFGYVNDPTALFCGLIDTTAKTLWVFDELYERGMTNEAIAEKVKAMGYAKERITADSAEPKSIDRLKTLGLWNVRPAQKGKDSITAGIDFLSDFHIIVHPRCVNFMTEASNYIWAEDSAGKKLNRPQDDFNHLMDAMRYAVEEFSKPHGPGVISFRR